MPRRNPVDNDDVLTSGEAAYEMDENTGRITFRSVGDLNNYCHTSAAPLTYPMGKIIGIAVGGMSAYKGARGEKESHAQFLSRNGLTKQKGIEYLAELTKERIIPREGFTPTEASKRRSREILQKYGIPCNL